ncbi:hypothetical protein OP853_004912 [Salmonella enterica]|nr:hypothetical protein [Salmonella enterica]
MVTAMRRGYRTGESWWPLITTLADPVTPVSKNIPPDPVPQVPAAEAAVQPPVPDIAGDTGDTEAESEGDDE